MLRASLFTVTPSHVASSKIECQNLSYVYRSRKHWECKYYIMKQGTIKNASRYLKNANVLANDLRVILSKDQTNLGKVGN